MKVYSSKEIKNIALLGNDGAGKTSLTESLLYVSGQINRKGRVSQQSTVSDYFPVEKNYCRASISWAERYATRTTASM